MSKDSEIIGKVCTKCGEYKISDCFSARTKVVGKYASWCKNCCSKAQREYRLVEPNRHREYARKYRENNTIKIRESNRKAQLKCVYGIDINWYNYKLEDQFGGCAICGQCCPSGKNLAIDHNHNTGFLRGLLCIVCNRKLTIIENDELLGILIEYLNTHRECQEGTLNIYRKRTYSNNPFHWKNESKKHYRERRLRRNFNMTTAEYNSMLEEQNGLCYICQEPPTWNSKILCVDHDHQTGNVRKLLCDDCNCNKLPPVEDSAWLNSAKAYLEKYRLLDPALNSDLPPTDAVD